MGCEFFFLLSALLTHAESQTMPALISTLQKNMHSEISPHIEQNAAKHTN